MDKRYQVFISSTYSDLKDERTKVMQTIMSLDCIPAGMELFPANDSEQFEFIKRIIDDCDYYIVIIGGRYGSLSSDGIGYTEKEFDYAIDKRIPVLAFLHENINQLSVEKSDVDDEKRTKLVSFRDKASSGRLVQFWTNADDLNGKVAVSLTKIIKTHPAIGWVKANFQASTEILSEMNDLRKELSELREYKTKNETVKAIDWEATQEFLCKSKYSGLSEEKTFSVSKSWKDILIEIGPFLDNRIKISHLFIEKFFKEYFTAEDDFKEIPFLVTMNTYEVVDVNIFYVKYFFLHNGIITIQNAPDDHFNLGDIWVLTDKGQGILAEFMLEKNNQL